MGYRESREFILAYIKTFRADEVLFKILIFLFTKIYLTQNTFHLAVECIERPVKFSTMIKEKEH